jgi:cyanuric acid amidohydrolase
MVLSQPVAVVGVVDAAHPGDTGPLETWLDANPLANVLCILGKTEGNGCVNDHTRGYATSAIKDALRRVQSRRIERASDDMRRKLPKLYDSTMDDAAIIMSGGTEGEHSPMTALNFVST